MICCENVVKNVMEMAPLIKKKKEKKKEVNNGFLNPNPKG